MKYGLLLTAVLVVPSAIFNAAVEGGESAPETRITPTVELFESAALVIVMLSVIGVVYLARRWHVGFLRGAVATIVQLVVVMVIAPLLMLVSRGGNLFESHHLSSPGPNGATFHVIGGGCKHTVYLQRPYALTMQRKKEFRMQHPRKIVSMRLEDNGDVTLLDQEGQPLQGEFCKGLFD
jgi:hypothetical protein